ncbi:hypothetical protein MSIMFI_00735 [Mycobacterium simulans]|nr:hypothetical protein MSIMFI_00735 [Mycobacterium simulans]
MSNVLDAIPSEPRAIIVKELTHHNPALLVELRGSQKPTNDRSDAVVDVLSDALVKTFGPDWAPSEYGLSIERAINAYLEAWPIYR